MAENGEKDGGGNRAAGEHAPAAFRSITAMMIPNATFQSFWDTNGTQGDGNEAPLAWL